MRNFNLIAFVLAGIGSLFAMPEVKIDTEAVKSDTAAVAAYVALESTPANPIPVPAIKIIPTDPAPATPKGENQGGVRLPGAAVLPTDDPGPTGKDAPDLPGSPLSTAAVVTLETPPPVLPAVQSPKASPAYSAPTYDTRWRLFRGGRRCLFGRCG